MHKDTGVYWPLLIGGTYRVVATSLTHFSSSFVCGSNIHNHRNVSYMIVEVSLCLSWQTKSDVTETSTSPNVSRCFWPAM